MITKYALRFTALAYLTLLLLVPVGMIAWKAFENGWAPFWASVTDPDFLQRAQADARDRGDRGAAEHDLRHHHRDHAGAAQRAAARA